MLSVFPYTFLPRCYKDYYPITTATMVLSCYLDYRL